MGDSAEKGSIEYDHKFIWDVTGFGCRCGKWSQRYGPLSDAEENHAAHVAEMSQTDREALGRVVRRVWIEWALEQPEPKPSWLVEWEDLPEPDREVDRRIGERLFARGYRRGFVAAGSPIRPGEAGPDA